MRVSGTIFAGFFLAAAGAVAGAQPIDVAPADDGYYPAPTGTIAPPSDDEAMPPHGSGLPNFTGLRGSFAFKNSATVNTPGAPTHAVNAKYDMGGGGSLYYGTRLPMGLRVELEGLYRYQPLQGLRVDNVKAGGVHGNAQMAAPMINLLWELPVTNDIPVQPFVGMGAGAAYTATNVNDGTDTYLKHNGWNLAYSFMAGANVPLSQSSRLSAMYRWMQVRDVKYGCAGAGAILGACHSTNLSSQGIDLGLEMDL
jgi:opacity protein-like surface antigen